jgi:hypothetical protein
MTKRLLDRTGGRVVQLDSQLAPAPFIQGPMSAVFGRAAFFDYNP